MDASGRLGSSLVKRLLQRGYSVHAAAVENIHAGICDVLSMNEISCENNSKRLKIFKSDPFDYQSIVDALRGCSALFYTFEPPRDQPAYNDESMGEVEIRAAHNALEACAQVNTIDKVVFSSSATAVIWTDDRKSYLDERHWSDINFCRKFKLWYALSKTLAEKTAWALAMDRGVNMVCINAGLLLAPDLSITNPYLKGVADMYEDGVSVTVDLNFLVDAHICVFEDVSTYGRYLCFNHAINCNENEIKLAKLLYPQADQSFEEDKRMIQQRISNKKLNKLMVNCEGGSKVD